MRRSHIKQGPAAVALALALTGLLGGGCASSPPSSFYTLTAMAGDAGADANIRGGRLAIGVGPVSIPRFLDRPQVVRRQGANQLELDEFHRWGGSLDDDFPRVLAENLAGLLRTSRIVLFANDLRLRLDVRVPVEILAFETGPSNHAVLKVRWAVLDPNTEEILVMREDLYRERLPADASVSQQIAALSAVLAAFSRDVASELRRLSRPKPPARTDLAP